MPNPLQDYVTAFTPGFDYTDSRTWYDGMWGGGQWPPEGYPGWRRGDMGMRGIGDNLLVWNQPAAFFQGDWARWAAARKAGMAGVGTSSNPNIVCDASCNCVDQTTLNIVDPTTAGCSVAAPQPSPVSSPPCVFSQTPVQLLPNQVYCATGTTTPPAPISNLQNQQQQQGAMMLVLGGAVILLLFVFAKI